MLQRLAEHSINPAVRVDLPGGWIVFCAERFILTRGDPAELAAWLICHTNWYMQFVRRNTR
jgi:hypothetical protein